MLCLAQDVKIMKYILFSLPNPPDRNINREFAGGFGTLGTISSETLLPTYLLYGASAVERSGCEYEILDAQAEKYTPAQVADAVKKAKPDVLITWVSLPSLYDDLRVLYNIKQTAPNMLIAVPGAVSNAMPEEILNRDCVDINHLSLDLYYKSRCVLP
jgi:hypothetical protein